MKQFSVLAAIAALSLAACASGPHGDVMSNQIGVDDPGFGTSVRHNIEAQTVNPNPVNADAPIPGNGSRAAIAQDRYLKDKVKQPPDISTSSSGGGSSGGSTGAGATGGGS